MQYVSYFPGDMRGKINAVYGPFNSKEEAVEHARTLSIDPDEGEVTELRFPDAYWIEFVNGTSGRNS